MVSIKNVPNILTISRGVIIFIIIGLFYGQFEGKFPVILVLFWIASITDFFDGLIARHYNVISKFGIVFDSLFDKVLILSMFMLLIPYNIVPGWILVLFLIRELIVDALKNYLLSIGKPVKARMAGKIKMVVQVAFITTALLWLSTKNPFLSIVSFWLAIFGLLIAYLSGWEYLKLWTEEKQIT